MPKRVVFAIIPLCASCYTYVPIRPASAIPGTSVRAHITSETSARIAPLLGMADVHDLAGRLIDNSGGTMVIEVPTVVQAGSNNAVESLFQRVTVTPDDIIGLESRTLNRGRTALLAAAAAATLGSVAVSALHNKDRVDGPPGQTGGTEMRVPLFRFHLP